MNPHAHTYVDLYPTQPDEPSDWSIVIGAALAGVALWAIGSWLLSL